MVRGQTTNALTGEFNSHIIDELIEQAYAKNSYERSLLDPFRAFSKQTEIHHMQTSTFKNADTPCEHKFFERTAPSRVHHELPNWNELNLKDSHP
jgi:predicted alpha/beta-fold hydrolase